MIKFSNLVYVQFLEKSNLQMDKLGNLILYNRNSNLKKLSGEINKLTKQTKNVKIGYENKKITCESEKSFYQYWYACVCLFTYTSIYYQAYMKPFHICGVIANI